MTVLSYALLDFQNAPSNWNFKHLMVLCVTFVTGMKAVPTVPDL